jgi:hypothetical protein
MKPGPASTWMTEAAVARARELWDLGVSTREIGRQVGCTKSSVVGYAHRQGWPPRPSPIIRNGKRAEAVERVPDKPHHKAAGAAPGTATQRAKRAAQRAQQRNEWGETPMREAVRPERLAVPTATFSRCQWITSDGRPWAMCDAPVPGTGPYCEEHRTRARERRPSVRDAWVSAA